MSGQRLDHAFLDRRDVVARDRAADNLVRELEACAPCLRFDPQGHARVLTMAAGLFLVQVLGLADGCDRLAVGHAAVVDFNLDLELAEEPIGGELDV